MKNENIESYNDVRLLHSYKASFLIDIDPNKYGRYDQKQKISTIYADSSNVVVSNEIPLPNSKNPRLQRDVLFFQIACFYRCL